MARPLGIRRGSLDEARSRDATLVTLSAKRLIADPPNRFAAFHLEQATEKLVKAVRLGRGLRVTADHNIEALIDELPPAIRGAQSCASSNLSPRTRRRIATRP
jgi:HEPN domain-containing protein